MITPLIIANWKMAIDADGVDAFKATWNSKPSILGIKAVVAPPAPYLPFVQGLSRLSLCAQNVSENEQGAHTGEIAASMLTDFGCQYVLVGHTPSDAKIRGRLMPSWRRRRSAPTQWA